MKHIMILLLTFVSFSLDAADVPIIFVDGQKNIAKPFRTDPSDPPYEDADYGIETWYPMKNDSTLKYPTAMTKIIDSHYGGYISGNPLNCDKNTVLQPMNTTKVIYNFSYYRPDGGRGVIGSQRVSTNYLLLNPVVSSGDREMYDNYRDNYLHGDLWAENFALFVGKVLEACYGKNWYDNPNAQVDIVAHSMGGLVARVAIKWFGIPVVIGPDNLTRIEPLKFRVRKLIMVATPNHGAHGNLATVVVRKHPKWMKFGEDLEMNIYPHLDLPNQPNVMFKNKNTGEIDTWCNLVGYDNDGVDMAVIRGTRGKLESQYGDNDKDVTTASAYFPSALFNPKIFASHDYPQSDSILEYSLPSCTYTTEFIKKWMIDDEVIVGAKRVTDPALLPNPWGNTSNAYTCASLRICPGVDDYSKALAMTGELYTEIGGIISIKGFPVYNCPKEIVGPVYYLSSYGLGPDVYIDTTWVYDMNGEVNHSYVGFGESILSDTCRAKLDIFAPHEGEVVLGGWDGITYPVRFWSNDYAAGYWVNYYSYSDGNWHFVQNISNPCNHGYHKYDWDLSGLSNSMYAKIGVHYHLVPYTLNAVSDDFYLQKARISPFAWHSWGPAGKIKDIAVAKDSLRYVYAIVDYGVYDLLYKSEDGGKTWKFMFTPGVNGTRLYSLGVSDDGKNVVLGGDVSYDYDNSIITASMLLSTDGGNNFSNIDYNGSISLGIPLTQHGSVQDVEVDSRNSQIYAGFVLWMISPGDTCRYGSVIKSDDNGETWNVILTPDLSASQHLSLQLALHPINKNYIYVSYDTTLSRVNVNTGGETKLYQGTKEIKAITAIADGSVSRIYLSQGDKIYTKKEGETNWVSSQLIDKNSNVYSLDASSNRGIVIAGTGYYANSVYLENSRNNWWEKIRLPRGDSVRVVAISPLNTFSNDPYNYKGIYYFGTNESLYVYNPFDGVPGVVSNLQVENTTSTSIVIKWDGVNDVIGYKVYWGENSGVYTDSGDAGLNTTFTINNDWETNYIEVRGYNFQGEGTGTSIYVFRLKAPTNLIANALSLNEIKVKWEDNSNYEQEYIIERNHLIPDGGWEGWNVIGTVGVNDTVFYDKSVTAYNKYGYRVRATDGTYYSSYSNISYEYAIPIWTHNPEALSFNNGRNIAVDPTDGTICLVHTDQGKVWYTNKWEVGTEKSELTENAEG